MFGDSRRSSIVLRNEAKVIDYNKRVTAEPITVVLSSKGWVRAGKGHDVDPISMLYKAGDEHKAHALGQSDQNAVFIDSDGRAYSILANILPSIRGYGEPLTSKVTPADGATFVSVIMGNPTDRYLILTSTGYGFIVTFEDLLSKNRKGKGIVSLSLGAKVLIVKPITNVGANCKIAIVSSEGKLLIFPLDVVPILAKGKGKKLLGLQNKDISHIETIVALAILRSNAKLQICTNKRKIILNAKDLESYYGEAGQKGYKLPKELQNVISLEEINA
jgi:topoisomerase-4 subunit A